MTRGNFMKMTEEKKTIMNARKAEYSEKDILRINASIKKAKNSDLPYLSKKNVFLLNYLLGTRKEDKFNYTLDSISNLYRKEIENKAVAKAKKENYKFRKSFNACELFNVNDIKSVIQYIYVTTDRQFEYYRNKKGNYLIHEVDRVENLTMLVDRK